MKKNHNRLRFAAVFVLLISSIILAAGVGSANLSMSESFWMILSKIPFFSSFYSQASDEVYIKILFQIRFPRIFLSVLVGGGLSMVGAVFQGIFRNPLADPHVLGVSSGAALGATIAILCGIQINLFGLGAIGLCAFFGSLFTIFLIYGAAGGSKKMSTLRVLLTGTAVSTMLSAVISLLMSLNRNGIERVYLWTLGSFSASSWMKVNYMVCLCIICGGVLFFFSKELNLLSMGEDTAESLGVETTKVKVILIAAASLLTAGCVSVSGIIGFVGLIMPHCMRFLFGTDQKRLLPASFLGGAVFMLICDTIARTITAPSEIPVGVVTSMLGAPYFIWLIRKNQ